MKLHPRLSRATIALVSRFETFHPCAKPTGSGWTIGYGHTRTAREGAQVGRADAEALLLFDLSLVAQAVEAELYAPAAQRQFEALTAFCFNIGVDNFRRSSALARFNAGAELEAADEIERWKTAELGAGAQVVDALVRRRAAEKAHFLGLPEGFSKSPSALLRPLAVSAALAPDAIAQPPSATLTAANGIQARLRELVPEPPADVQRPIQAADSGPAEMTAPPFPEPVEPGIERVRDEPSDADLVPLEVVETTPALSEPLGRHLVAPPPPPPQPSLTAPSADNLVPAQPGPAGDVAALAPEAPGDEGRAADGRLRSGLRITRRQVYCLIAALGACLFAAALVLTLGGRPTVLNLLLGVVGALTLIPGIYGLLGPPRQAG